MKAYPRITLNEAVEALEARGGNIRFVQEFLDRKEKTFLDEQRRYPEWYSFLKKQAQDNICPF